jgi:DNA-binding FadR family transcriptional regulator
MSHFQLTPSENSLSEFLRYLANDCDDNQRLPTLPAIAKHLGVSISVLREQLEVARALGIVEVRPKTGIRRLAYTFRPAVRKSLAYAIQINPDLFSYYADLRRHLETSYWHQAVSLISTEDINALRTLVLSAGIKLAKKPVQVPQVEHREFHISIYKKLNNVFVNGLFEAYWDLYESAGLDVYTNYDYLTQVWNYHEKMVDAIAAEDYDLGHRILMDHMNLLYQRPETSSNQKFE